MPKLRHSHRLPQNLNQIIGCDRVVLPASNNTTTFSYTSGNKIIRFEIQPQVGMISPFDYPRLKGRIRFLNTNGTNYYYSWNNYIGLQAIISQVKVSSLRTPSVLSDSSTNYPRQVSSVVYNSQGANEMNNSYLTHEMKASTYSVIPSELIATSVDFENNFLDFSIPLTTNLLESANLLSTHLYGLGGLQIEVLLASDASLLYCVPTNPASPQTAGATPTYEIDQVRLHYNLLRFNPAGLVQSAGLKQILFESTETRNDSLQSNDETRQIPTTGSAIQSLVMDAVLSSATNTYSDDSNQQATFGINTERNLIQGQSLPIQQELTTPIANQIANTGITQLQREAIKAVNHDASLKNIRSFSSQCNFDSIYKALGLPATNGVLGVELPYPRRQVLGVLFGKEGVPMKYGNISYRFVDMNKYAQDYNNATSNLDFPETPITQNPYTVYTHTTSLRVLNVDEKNGMVSVRV